MDCDDNNSCTTDTCNGDTGVCAYTTIDNCCGNEYCEIGESSSCTDDCGPFTLSTPDHSSYYHGVVGFVFDLNAINDIQISALSFYVGGNSGASASGTVTVFTAAQSYSGIETVSGSWTEKYSGTVAGSKDFLSCHKHFHGKRFCSQSFNFFLRWNTGQVRVDISH